MDWRELERRVGGGEDLRTEFKLEAVSADELAAALVAFANSDGGHLFYDETALTRLDVGVLDLEAVKRFVEKTG